jgi:hypothetical protein
MRDVSTAELIALAFNLMPPTAPEMMLRLELAVAAEESESHARSRLIRPTNRQARLQPYR